MAYTPNSAEFIFHICVYTMFKLCETIAKKETNQMSTIHFNYILRAKRTQQKRRYYLSKAVFYYLSNYIVSNGIREFSETPFKTLSSWLFTPILSIFTFLLLFVVKLHKLQFKSLRIKRSTNLSPMRCSSIMVFCKITADFQLIDTKGQLLERD